MRGVLALVLLLSLGETSAVSDAQPGPTIAFADSVCFGGRATILYGQGFVPGDTVYVEALPPVPRHLPIPPSQPSGTIRLATTTAGSDGRFAVAVTFADPITGRPFGGSPPGDTEYYAVLAFPASLDGRSTETVSRAPKAACAAASEAATPMTAVAPGGLPATGSGPRTGAESTGTTLVTAAIVLTAGLSLLGLARRVGARR